jgi:glycosyltransferase involved in cell wall biosynthesis
MYKIPTKLRMIWTGDSYDQLSNFGMGDKRVHSGVDCLLTVSQWQADRLSEESGFPRSKAWVLGNGIHPAFFEGTEKKIRKRLIYSSTPHRGLKHIPRLFPKVREKHPEAEIHIFSSYKVYDQDRERDFAEVFSALEKTPGVTLHGSVKQSELAREFMKSAVLFYPCDFEETSCITAIEAQAAGCVTVSTKLAALPETVENSGVLIDGMPGVGDYDAKYIEATNQVLSDDHLFQRLSDRGRTRAKELTWDYIAQRFSDFLKSKLA